MDFPIVKNDDGTIVEKPRMFSEFVCICARNVVDEWSTHTLVCWFYITGIYIICHKVPKLFNQNIEMDQHARSDS